MAIKTGYTTTVLRRKAKDGANGINAIYADLDNEFDSMLYTGDGTKITSSVTSKATLYDGGVTKTVTWSKYSDSGCTSSVSSNGTITVSAMSSTDGYVIAKATYNSQEYKVKFSVKKLVGIDKYELVVNKSAVVYNSTTNLFDNGSNACSIEASAYVTKQNKTRELVKILPSGYTLKCNSTSLSIDGTTGIATQSVSTGTTSYKFELKNGDILLDMETVGLSVVENGASGASFIEVVNYYQWGSSGTEPPTGTWAENSIPVHVAGYDYLWNYEICKRDKGGDVTSDTRCIGYFPRGIEARYEYYQLNNSTSAPSVDSLTTGLNALGVSDTPADSYGNWTLTASSTTDSQRYLWNVEVVKLSDGTYSIGTPHTVCAQGPKGADNTSYVIDMDNEMTGVPCDSSNHPTAAATVSTTLQMFFGATALKTKVSSIKTSTFATDGYQLSRYGVTAKEGILKVDVPQTTNVIQQAIHNLFFSVEEWGNGKVGLLNKQPLPNPLEIDIELTCVESGTHYGQKRSARLSIIPAQPGANGKDAVVLDIIPSLSTVVFAKQADGTVDSTNKTLTAQVRKVQGSDERILEYNDSSLSGYNLYYDKTGYPEVNPLGSLIKGYSYPGSVTVNNSDTRIYFALYYGTTLVDKESVPVIKDGANGGPGSTGPAGKGILRTQTYYQLSGGNDNAPLSPTPENEIDSTGMTDDDINSAITTLFNAPLSGDYAWKTSPESMTTTKPNQWSYTLTLYTDYSIIKSPVIVIGSRFMSISADEITAGTLDATIGIQAKKGTIAGWNISPEYIHKEVLDNDTFNRFWISPSYIMLDSVAKVGNRWKGYRVDIDPTTGIHLTREEGGDTDDGYPALTSYADMPWMLGIDASGWLANKNIAWDHNGVITSFKLRDTEDPDDTTYTQITKDGIVLHDDVQDRTFTWIDILNKLNVVSYTSKSGGTSTYGQYTTSFTVSGSLKSLEFYFTSNEGNNGIELQKYVSGNWQSVALPDYICNPVPYVKHSYILQEGTYRIWVKAYSAIKYRVIDL